MLNPRELLPLAAVTAEFVGEGGWLVWSSPSTYDPSGSVCALRATTYSYVVIPCTHKSDISKLSFKTSLCVCEWRVEIQQHGARKNIYKTFQIKII